MQKVLKYNGDMEVLNIFKKYISFLKGTKCKTNSKIGWKYSEEELWLQ